MCSDFTSEYHEFSVLKMLLFQVACALLSKLSPLLLQSLLNFDTSLSWMYMHALFILLMYILCWFLMLIPINSQLTFSPIAINFWPQQRADGFSWGVSFYVWCQWRASSESLELHLADLNLHFTFYLLRSQINLLYCHIAHIICILSYFYLWWHTV